MPQCNLLGKGLKKQETFSVASGGAGHAALTHQQGAKVLLPQAVIHRCNFPCRKDQLSSICKA